MVTPVCPSCGGPLAALDTTARPDTAPWLCNVCHRGWWAAELTPTARRAFDPVRRDFGDHGGDLADKVRTEREVQRGQQKGGG